MVHCEEGYRFAVPGRFFGRRRYWLQHCHHGAEDGWGWDRGDRDRRQAVIRGLNRVDKKRAGCALVQSALFVWLRLLWEKGEMMKRLVAIMLMLVCTGLLAGCGSDKGRDENKDKDKPKVQKDVDK